MVEARKVKSLRLYTALGHPGIGGRCHDGPPLTPASASKAPSSLSLSRNDSGIRAPRWARRRGSEASGFWILGFGPRSQSDQPSIGATFSHRFEAWKSRHSEDGDRLTAFAQIPLPVLVIILKPGPCVMKP